MMQILKSIMTHDEAQQLVDALATRQWDSNMFASERMRVDVNELPIVHAMVERLFADQQFVNGSFVYFQRYQVGTGCKLHNDPSRKTLIVPLTAYEGGQLTVGDQIVELAIGDGVLFDGEAMHSVSPVTQGTRITLAVWFR